MEQESETNISCIKRNKDIAIIGAGAAGCICAYFLKKAGFRDITLFDFGSPLRTLLPTGGGRCNMAHEEYDFRELAKNYPRGEKFLYSIFSRFAAADTIDLFKEIGVNTYAQDNGRIFPESNSAKDVREKILEKINNIEIIREKVVKIDLIDNGFKISTIRRNNKSECCYFFSNIVVAVGGHSSLDLIKDLGIKTIPFKPSLVGLNADIQIPPGIVLKNVLSKDFNIKGDILFTHFGVSGPLIYTISSYKARENFPYKLSFDLCPNEIKLQSLLNNNPHKDLKNILADYFPINFVKSVLGDLSEVKAHKIDGKTRDSILDKIHNFEITAVSTNKGEETVSAGGVDLNEINPKTMAAKKYSHLYFIGECVDVDGLCGGFNLQNAWSTAFVAAEGIKQAYLD